VISATFALKLHPLNSARLWLFVSARAYRLRRPHVFVPQQFLNRTNIDSVSQQMSGERMAKCVAAGGLVQLQFENRCPHGFLHE